MSLTNRTKIHELPGVEASKDFMAQLAHDARGRAQDTLLPAAETALAHLRPAADTARQALIDDLIPELKEKWDLAGSQAGVGARHAGAYLGPKLAGLGQAVADQVNIDPSDLQRRARDAAQALSGSPAPQRRWGKGLLLLLLGITLGAAGGLLARRERGAAYTPRDPYLHPTQENPAQGNPSRDDTAPNGPAPESTTATQ